MDTLHHFTKFDIAERQGKQLTQYLPWARFVKHNCKIIPASIEIDILLVILENKTENDDKKDRCSR